MLDSDTRRRIDNARDILVGKVPDPKAQVEQITTALIYKFMYDLDCDAQELDGKPTFFTGEYERYSWAKLMDKSLGGYDRLSLYIEALDKLAQNPKAPQFFRDIFKNTFLPFRDPEVLTLFLKEIGHFTYDHSERLGDAFEYLLMIMGSQGDAGQFRTPRHIIDFMVSVVDPKKDETILDPACGTAGFLISAYKHIRKNNTEHRSGDKLTNDERKRLMGNFEGYDISPDMVRMSKVNMYLHDFRQPKIAEYDTLTSEDKWRDDFDVILTNPPFMSPKGGVRPHSKFQVQAKRTEVLFVDYVAEHLMPDGRAGVVVPEGIIFQSANAYKDLRKMLVNGGYLWAVLSLPSGVFNPYSGVKTSILFLDRKRAKHADTILFLKVESDGFDLGAQRRQIEASDLPAIAGILNRYRESGQWKLTDDEKRLAHYVPKLKIAESGDYNLNGERYREVVNHLHQNWPMVRLGDVCEVIAGQSPESEFYNEKGNGLPFYQGKTEFTEKFIGNPNYWTTKTTKIALQNDVLMSVRAPVGPVNIATQKICIGRGLAAIRAKESLNELFLYHFLKSQEKFITGNSGAAFSSINRKDIESIQVPLPPLSVQKEIVAEIEGYERIISGARQVVANWKPIIKIDPKWPMVKLGDENIFQIESGGTPDTTKSEYWDGDINWATLVDLPSENIITTVWDTKRKITGKGLKCSSAKLLPKGTVIISSRATIGRIGIAQTELATNQGFKNILIKNEHIINNMFFALMMTRLVETMEKMGTGGTYKEVSKSSMKSLQIPLPPLHVQKEIVAEIETEQATVEANKKLIERYKAKIEEKIGEVWGK